MRKQGTNFNLENSKKYTHFNILRNLVNLMNLFIFTFLFSFGINAMNTSYTRDIFLYDLNAFVVGNSYETINNDKNDPYENWRLEVQIAQYRNLSLNSNKNHNQYSEKWLYDYLVMPSQDDDSSVKVIFKNKIIVSFHDRAIHALSMSEDGKTIAALSPDALRVANLRNDTERQYYIYNFKEQQSLISKCICAALNKAGNIAAVGGTYNEGKNSCYRICVFQLNTKSSLIENLLYIIHLPNYYPISLWFIDHFLLINSNKKGQEYRRYNLQKGSEIIERLIPYQTELLYNLYHKVVQKKGIFYNDFNYNPQAVILTPEEFNIVRELDPIIINFI